MRLYRKLLSYMVNLELADLDRIKTHLQSED